MRLRASCKSLSTIRRVVELERRQMLDARGDLDDEGMGSGRTEAARFRGIACEHGLLLRLAVATGPLF